MRTDVKIGIAVGLLAAVLMVAYFALSKKDASRDDSATPPAPRNEIVRTDVPPAAPVAPSSPTITWPDISSRTTTAPAPVVIVTTPPPTTGPVDVFVTPHISSTPVAVTPLPPAATEHSYTVKEGDSGFWAVAQKEYGDGKYWTLIAKANPNVDSSHLRAGQVLKIPPKPSDATAGGATPVAGSSGGAADAYYTVQSGDNGFWTIAEKKYGDGKYWTLIAKANPNVDSGSLRVGQKIVLPAKPSSATTAPSAAGTITPVRGASPSASPARTSPTPGRPYFD